MAKLTENDVKALARWVEENKQQDQMLLNQANTIKQLQAEVERLKSERAMTKHEYSAFLELLMCSDPYPADGKEVLKKFADVVAKQFGFSDWICAYHVMGEQAND